MGNIHDAFLYGRATTSGELERMFGELGWDKLPTTKEWETLKGLEEEVRGCEERSDGLIIRTRVLGRTQFLEIRRTTATRFLVADTARRRLERM